MRRVGQDLETQAGDTLEAVVADDAVFVLVGVRARSLDGAVGFLLQDGAFGGLEGVGLDDLPGLPAAGGLLATFLKPGREGRFGRDTGGGFGRFGRVDELLGFGDGAGGVLGLVGEEGLGGAAGLAVFVDAVEEGGEGVVVGLRDRVELVAVALRAAERHAQPGRAHGVHAVEDVVDA